MPNIPIAIVGCGGMGRRHLRGLHLLAQTEFSNLDLRAVCDLNRQNAEDLADEAAGLLGRRPQVFGLVADMVAGADSLEAVDITTDIVSHHRLAVDCLNAGLHVLIEKPLALTVRACNLIINVAQKAGRVLSVAENYRRDPINRLVKALIDDGAIGRPRLVTQTSISGRDQILITPWRHDKFRGAPALEFDVHYADILRYYFGEAQSVSGQVRLWERVRRNTRAAGPGGFYAKWSDSFPDQVEATGEDALYAQVQFANGAVGSWIGDHAGHGESVSERRVFGSKGSLVSPGDRNGRPVKLYDDDGASIADERILEFTPSYRLSPLAAHLFGGERVWTYGFGFNETDGRILALEYHEFGSCIRGGQPPEVNGEEGRAAVALVYAAFESDRLGRAVSLAEVLAGEADLYQRELDERLGLV